MSDSMICGNDRRSPMQVMVAIRSQLQSSLLTSNRNLNDHHRSAARTPFQMNALARLCTPASLKMRIQIVQVYPTK